MKCTGPSESEKFAFVLEHALAREAKIWKVPIFQDFTLKGTDIPPSYYEKAVLWIGELSSLFQFCSGTFALATSILNRLLASVKIIPSVKKLVVQSGCKCSPAEILRMERIVLDKLHWDLYTATSMDFLNIFHAMVMSKWTHLLHGLPQRNPSRHAAFLTKQLQHCMACHQLLQFKGSTLALVIITLELERLTPDWFPVITDLLKKAQIDSTQFIHCKELVDQHLQSFQPSNAVYIFNPASQNIQTRLGERLPCCYPMVKKDVQSNLQAREIRAAPAVLTPLQARAEVPMETDEFYDGFKYLYNEDRTPEAGQSSSECLRQKESCHFCPPLEPAPKIE
ncbi:cyclin-I2 isoform X2 [Paroedura picta]|uniref:cyclin-I2 isoform X2 n=1 Tax=Paroedura picta TaxID=143630 RepID=UPI004056EED3